MMQVAPYDAHDALIVFTHLDPWDAMEAAAVRGAKAPPAQLFAEWHAAQAHAALSLVLKWGGVPFAVLVLGNTGQAGVAEAAMLARTHRHWRAGLVRAGREVRAGMAEYCQGRGINRIEARCWADHPRAGAFLRLCGFTLEAIMPGFGADGRAVFHQYAWTKGEQHVHRTQ